MNYGTLVPSFYFYKFADAVSQPYTSFMAYSSGSIDANGNFLKPESSIDPFEYFVIKLKKIFEQLPPGLTKYQLSNYAASLNLFSEEAEKFNIPKEHFVALVEGHLAANYGPEVSYMELLEDMSAGGMAVAASSPGYNTGGVSGFDPVMKPSIRRRPVTDEMFHMFDVSSDDFTKITNNNMNEIDYLRRFGIRNPDSTIMVRNKKDGNLFTIPKRKKLKEQFNIDFLFEKKQGIVASYTDSVVDPGKNVAVLPNEKEKAKQAKKGFERPKPHANATHADRFREDVKELINLHRNAKNEAQAEEYAARLLFHTQNYYALKDTPHIGEYMDKTHQQIVSSASATDTGSKTGDIIIPEITDSGIEYKPHDFKTKGGSKRVTIPVSLIQKIIEKHPEELESWTKTTPNSRQSSVFPKITVGDVSFPAHRQSAHERFNSMVRVINALKGTDIGEELQRLQEKARQKAGNTPLVVKHQKTGRYHIVSPSEVEVTLSQQGGQADKAFQDEHQRHIMAYRVNYNQPPADSKVFELDKGAQDTLLQYADPEHHELLKQLSDIHITKN